MTKYNLPVKEKVERKFERIYTEVFDNAQDASVEVAQTIAHLIRSKAKSNSNCVLGLATGSSPIGVYQELVRMHREEGLSFQNVITFNLDEYHSLPKDHIQSYWYFMHKHLFEHIDILPENIHIPDGMVAEDSVFDFCQKYEMAIQQAGGIDLQILGIGRTGHVGFNEPGSGIDSPTRMVHLDTLTIADAAGDFASEENVPNKAITMGVGTIMQAREVILLAWGEKKASIIHKAVEGNIIHSVPATFLQKHPNTKFVLDKEAAAELTRFYTPWLVKSILWDEKRVHKAVLWLCELLDKPLLKLTNRDYNDNSLGDILLKYGSAYNTNLLIFNKLQKSITGWPGGKPNADDSHRPERALPYPKRVLIFSPHAADDMLAMGGTINRLVQQGHQVHIVYQTSGNIAVSDEVVLKFLYFAQNISKQLEIDVENIQKEIANKNKGDVDSNEIRTLKTYIREAEARLACAFLGIPEAQITFLKMPFYETGTIKKYSLGTQDIHIITEKIRAIHPHQIYAAGDLTDPHGTHRKCFDALTQAIQQVKNEDWFVDCRTWLYHGTWKEWAIADVDMAVPISPEELRKKRAAIFKHESQKEIMFPGSEELEIWRYAIERNRDTARKYDKIGMAEYEAIELFVEYHA